MEEYEFAEVLADALEVHAGADSRSFAQGGLMTSDTGLVVRLEDGSEFQVTIVRSN